MKKSHILAISALAASCLFGGCSGLWYLNIRNETNSPVKAFCGEVSRQKIEPGEVVRLPMLPGRADEIDKREVIVSSASGKLIVRANALKLLHSAGEQSAEYPDAYFILSDKGLRPTLNQHPR